MKSKFFLFLSLWILAILLDSLYPLDVGCDLAIIGVGSAMLLAGGLSAGSSLLGSLMNSSAQDRANTMNSQMNWNQLKWDQQKLGLQMDFDREMYQKQMDYNDKIISMMNDYNSAKSQRQRLEEAGYNPYLAFGNVDAGSASSGVGISQPSAPSGGSFNPIAMQSSRPGDIIANTGRDIASLYQAFNQGDLMNQQALNMKIKNMHENDRQIAEIDKILASGKVDKEQADILRQSKDDLIHQNKYLTMSMKYDSKTKSEEYQQAVIDTKMRKVEFQILEWRNDFDKRLGEKNIQLTDKQIQHLDHVIWNLDADSALKTAQTVIEEAKKIGVDISNEQARQLAPLLVQKQALENRSIELSNKYGSNAYTFGGRIMESWSNFLRHPFGNRRSGTTHFRDYKNNGRLHTVTKY